jgi:diadenylate cyclase
MQSDAVVLIVSEETGLISIAHDGKIYRGLDQATLHEMLVTLLAKEDGSGRAAMLRPLQRVGTLRTLGRRSHP